MQIIKIILSVIFIIDCIALTVVVLMQEGKQEDLVLSPEQQKHTGVRTKVVPWRADLLRQPLLWELYFL